jgi:SAM-dependent methyltransferase
MAGQAIHDRCAMSRGGGKRNAQAVPPDTATLRRELVGAGLLQREQSVYWRPPLDQSSLASENEPQLPSVPPPPAAARSRSSESGAWARRACTTLRTRPAGLRSVPAQRVRRLCVASGEHEERLRIRRVADLDTGNVPNSQLARHAAPVCNADEGGVRHVPFCPPARPGAAQTGKSVRMAAINPDYDRDPQRSQAWQAPHDVHEIVAPELNGPVLDVGCGDGRLASLLDGRVAWIGVDSSRTQLEKNPHRPVVLADMRMLPFRDGVFAEVTQLWCLYHVDDPVVAIREAWRVLRPGGRYYASTAARNNDPEIMWEGYPPSPFDAEEAVAIVASVFKHVEPRRWDGRFFSLHTRDEVRAYCRHHDIPAERAEAAELPLWLTKRGVLVRATRD